MGFKVGVGKVSLSQTNTFQASQEIEAISPQLIIDSTAAGQTAQWRMGHSGISDFAYLGINCSHNGGGFVLDDTTKPGFALTADPISGFLLIYLSAGTGNRPEVVVSQVAANTLSFFGATPASKVPAYTNTGGTTTKRSHNYGTLNATVTNVTPYGFPTAGAAENVVNGLNELKQIVQQLIVDLRGYGLVT